MATKAIPVVAAKVASTQTDFPVYVQPSTMTGWGALTLAEVESMRWYSDEALTTELASDPVSADEIHVKVPSLTTTTTIYVDYDGVRAKYAVTDTYGRNAVWTDYAAVYHLNNTTDSTGNGNTLTATNSATITTGQSKLGTSSADFTANSNARYAATGSDFGLTATGQMSISCWFKNNVESTRDYELFLYINENGTSDYMLRSLYEYAGGARRVRAFKYDASYTFMDVTGNLGTAWNYHSYSYNNGAEHARLNTSTVTGTTDNSTTSVTTLTDGIYFGMSPTTAAGNGLNGYIDEFRVAEIELSADRTLTEYNNQNDVSTFWGTVTDVAGGVAANNSARRMLLMQM